MILYITILLLVALAGISKAKQDNEVRTGSVNSTWTKKWAHNSSGLISYDNKSWWYFGLYKPAFKEAYFMSSTWLTWTTDKWHLWGTIRDMSLICCISVVLMGFTFKCIITIVILRIVMATIFHILFHKKTIK